MFDITLSQGTLFGSTDVGFDPSFVNLRRLELGEGSWIDYAPMWLTGHEELFRRLVDGAEWSQPVVQMYEREVVTPRLVARFEPDLDPALLPMIEALSDRYGIRLDRLSAGWYRTGADSVAMHGDRLARDRDEATVATVSLGAARRFSIRSKSGGPSRSLSLGHGDLVVMGGSCQRTHEHGIPKTTEHVEPRIALMFRPGYD